MAKNSTHISDNPMANEMKGEKQQQHLTATIMVVVSERRLQNILLDACLDAI
jgi:hypothetical protein